MNTLKLYMILLGCRPKGRHTEQHDMFFGIGHSLSDLVPQIKAFWPELKGNIHIDAWREVTEVDGYEIKVMPRGEVVKSNQSLFFLNLGGYKKEEFEEYHYKVLTVTGTLDEAKLHAKQTAFYKHTGFTGSHIDDRYGVDTDDAHEVKDILPDQSKEKYKLHISHNPQAPKDTLYLGYLPLFKIPG